MMLKLVTLLCLHGLLGFVESDEVCGDKICKNGGVCNQNICLCTSDYEGNSCSKKKMTTTALVAIILICALLLIAILIAICIIRRRRTQRQVPLIQKKSRRSDYHEEEEPRISIAEADIQENLRRHPKNLQRPINTISESTTDRPIVADMNQQQPRSSNSQQSRPMITTEPTQSNLTITSPKLKSNGIPDAEVPLKRQQNPAPNQSDIIRRERPVPRTRVFADDNSTMSSSVKMHAGEPLAPVNYLTPRSTISTTSSTTDHFSNGASFWYPAYIGGPTGGMGGSVMMMGSSTSLTKAPLRK